MSILVPPSQTKLLKSRLGKAMAGFVASRLEPDNVIIAFALGKRVHAIKLLRTRIQTRIPSSI